MKKNITLLILFLIFEISFSMEFIFRDDFYYDDIEFLCRKGAIDLDISDIPLRSDKLIVAIENGWINRMKEEKGFSNEEQYAINNLLGRYSINDNINIRDFASFNVVYEDSIRMNITNEIYLKKNIPYGIISADFRTVAPYENTDSTKFRMDEWRGTGSDCYNTFISLYGDNWTLLLGRIHPSWGQGIKDDIFLSRKILPMDGILADIDWGNVKFSYFTANKTEYHYANKNTISNAYLSAHKISFSMPLKSEVSFKEMIIYRSNLPQLYYLNPAMFYYIIQYNSHSDDNIFWSLEFSNKLLKGFIFNTEIFIDDFQYEKNSIYVPNKIGVLVNASYSPLFMQNIIFYGEYCGMNTYTNTHEYEDLVYSYYTVPMSYLEGTDMDNISFGVIYRHFDKLNFDFDVSYMRKGEGELTNSWESESPDSALMFPSGTIDKILSLCLRTEYSILKKINISFEAKESFLNGFAEKSFVLTGFITVIL